MSRLPRRLSGAAALSISAVATLMGAHPVAAADLADASELSAASSISSCSDFFLKYGDMLQSQEFFQKIVLGARSNTFYKGGLFGQGNGWHKGETLNFYKAFDACAGPGTQV